MIRRACLLRILHVYKTYFPDHPGGIQEAVRQICLATRARGLENTIFALSPTPTPTQLERPEGMVVRCRSWLRPASCDLGGAEALTTFRRLAASADIIHYQYPWPFADILHGLAGGGIPALLTYQSDVVRQRLAGFFYHPLRRRMFNAMRAIVATSPRYMASSPVLSDPALASRLRMIPLGIAEESWPAAEDRTIGERLGLDPAEPYFLFVGALRYYKGLDTLLQAAAMLKAPVVIAGSGPSLPDLRARAEACRAHRVIFAGMVTDAEKRALISGCRALVLPSHLRSEAFGMVLVEASMLGRPMITCEIGTATSWVNRHQQTGLVVPPSDPVALADAMRQLQGNETWAATLARGARARYEQYFTGRSMGEAYHALYREILASEW